MSLIESSGYRLPLLSRVSLVDAFGRPMSSEVGGLSRGDSWQNHTTGIGTWRDKTTHGHFTPSLLLQDPEILAIVNGSDLGAKMAFKRPEEYFRRGYDLKAKGVDASDVSKLRKMATDLRLDFMLEKAAKWGRAFGGAVVIVGADDGQTPDMPLREEAIRDVKFVTMVDKRYARVRTWYTDPLAPKHGEPQTYWITQVLDGGGPYAQGPLVTVHESRVIRFEGQDTDDITKRQLAGWTFSVLQRVYDTVRKFEHNFDAIGNLLSDASQAVWKLKGLIDMIAAGQHAELQKRSSSRTSRARRCARSWWTRTRKSFRGNRRRSPAPRTSSTVCMMRVASAADKPVTIPGEKRRRHGMPLATGTLAPGTTRSSPSKRAT